MVRRLDLPLQIHLTCRVTQYFYLFINIGALIGQISMAYSEKVSPYVSRLTIVAGIDEYVLAVRRLLARLHAPHHRVLHLPGRPLRRSQHVLALPAHRLRPLPGSPYLAPGDEGSLVLQPRHHVQEHECP